MLAARARQREIPPAGRSFFVVVSFFAGRSPGSGRLAPAANFVPQARVCNQERYCTKQQTIDLYRAPRIPNLVAESSSITQLSAMTQLNPRCDTVSAMAAYSNQRSKVASQLSYQVHTFAD